MLPLYGKCYNVIGLFYLDNGEYRDSICTSFGQYLDKHLRPYMAKGVTFLLRELSQTEQHRERYLVSRKFTRLGVI